ncbi:hypothetical protein B0O80DRAFT_463659 [Mortierella sp. GBAus27b]|nr:hypothetical protein BGX31_006353 [Mortierella sp. GBA43]KAI8348091.1 hypothetical protein B0O80DRAFT_463659 [Mortierella sp. GBAus27b]
MGNINPLELPEIMAIVARYLSHADLVRCLTVSKSWHSSFLSLVWSTVSLRSGKPQPKDESLYLHRQLVKELHLDTALFLEVECQDVPFEYSNLTSLEVHGRGGGIDKHCGAIIWQRARGLQNLSRLKVSLTMITEAAAPVFWELCTRLEQLHMEKVSIMAPPERSVIFERMQHLSLLPRVSHEVDWISQCPNLAILDCYIRARHKGLVGNLTKCVSSGSFSKLSGLKLDITEISDERLAGMIEGMHQATMIYIPKSWLGPLSLTALRRHIPFLRHVRVYSRHEDISAVAIDMLSSCSQLEYLATGKIKSQYFLDSPPWVCVHSLKTLQVSIFLPEDQDQTHHQERFLRKISQLVHLESLYLGLRIKLEDSDVPWRYGLGEGLNHLASLRKLRTLNLRGLELTMDDVEWMISNWRSLKFVGGTLNSENNEELAAMFQGTGIKYSSKEV